MRDSIEYPPQLDRLFTELRSVIVPFLEMGTAMGMNSPEVGAIAILGEHVAICFAGLEPQEVRDEAIASWMEELPRVVEMYRAQLNGRSGTLQ